MPCQIRLRLGQRQAWLDELMAAITMDGDTLVRDEMAPPGSLCLGKRRTNAVVHEGAIQGRAQDDASRGDSLHCP